MVHLSIKDGRISMDERSDACRACRSRFNVYAVRDAQGRLLVGDGRLSAVPMNGDTSQLIALMRLGERRVRSLTTRFDTSGGVTLITVAERQAGRGASSRWGS